MATYQGIVKDNVVLLPEGVELEDGTQVEVRPVGTEGAAGSAGAESDGDRTAEELFLQHLYEAGLIDKVKKPSRVTPEGDRTPVEVKGKPVSETIIEDRR